MRGRLLGPSGGPAGRGRGLPLFLALAFIAGWGTLVPPTTLAAGDDPGFPPSFTAADVYRLDLGYMDVIWLPVFQGNGRDLIAELASLYAAARTKLVADPLPRPIGGVLHFRPHLTVLLQEETLLTLQWIVETEVEISRREPSGSWTDWIVADTALADWLQRAPDLFDRPDTSGEWLLPSRRLHIGEILTIHLNALPETDHSDIYLTPVYFLVTVSGGPDGYPLPEPSLIATVVPREGSLTYSVALEGVLGRRPDGTPLVIKPGFYQVDICGGEQTGGWFLILPPPTPPAVVAVRIDRQAGSDRGLAAAWRPGEPVRTEILTGPDVPSRGPGADPCTWVTGSSTWVTGADPCTWVTTRFLGLSGLPVAVEGDIVRLGEGEAQAVLKAGEDSARVNDTMLQLTYPSQKVEGGLRVNGKQLEHFLEDEIYWPAPDLVFLVHGKPGAPLELLRVLDLLPAGGDPPLVLVNCIPVAGRAVVHDGRLYVPALEFASACRASAHEATGWAGVSGDFGRLGVDGEQRILIPDPVTWESRDTGARALIQNGHVYLPVRELARIFGGSVGWNEEARVAELWLPGVR